MKYYIFNKPYNVLSQFSRELPHHVTLQDYVKVSKDVYPIGRLDKDSEGLLLLTNDNRLKTKILDPKNQNAKSYLVQVDGQIDQAALEKLICGVDIKLKSGIYRTKPAKVKIIQNPNVEERNPPIRTRKNIPTSWIEITIIEGKNRQIRKMCAVVGYPCLRLIRHKIKSIIFKDVKSGNLRPLTDSELKLLQN